MIACRMFGHRWRFWNEDVEMRWECTRSCGANGTKVYPTVTEATRYAQAFNRDDRTDLGRRSPLGLFPLRLFRALRKGREHS